MPKKEQLLVPSITDFYLLIKLTDYNQIFSWIN